MLTRSLLAARGWPVDVLDELEFSARLGGPNFDHIHKRTHKKNSAPRCLEQILRRQRIGNLAQIHPRALIANGDDEVLARTLKSQRHFFVGGIRVAVQYGIDREKTLSSKLSAIQKEKLVKVAASYSVPLASLEPMKPWMAVVMFSILPLQKAGYDPDAGIDRFLKAQAEKAGDKIYGFETTEEQIRFLADLPESEQIAFLEETLGDAEKGMAQLEKLARAWIDGDNETIGNILVNELKKEAPAVYEKFLVQRNIAWSEKIAGILKRSGVRQIAVGAAHLAGPDSLQVQLAKRGIKVERY